MWIAYEQNANFTKIIDCYNIEENIYRFNYYDEVLADIGSIINIKYSLKNRTLQDIKKILGMTKKS